MDPVHILMDLAHGGGAWTGSMGQGSMFYTFPTDAYVMKQRESC